MKHVWIGESHRYLVTDNFDEEEGSEDMKALHQLHEFLRGRVALTPEQAAKQDEARARIHERNHRHACCREHGTHSMPHRGCILR